MREIAVFAMFSALFRLNAKATLVEAGLLIGLIAFADWRLDLDIPHGVSVPLGFLYLFPMLLAGRVLKRWQIAAVALVCTILSEAFDTFAWVPQSGIPRDILYFAGFFGMGLVVFEAVRRRTLAQEHLARIESEARAREEAEEQLQILVESSPAAIVTVDDQGRVLLSNDAAHRLFALAPGALAGEPIERYLPALRTVIAPVRQQQSFKTMMQCRGRRHDGEMFLADVWFSTYGTSAGPRLAAMVVDASEDLRSREELSLHQLLAASRILVGAVSHEIRNVCGAIAMVHANLTRGGALTQSKDFEALGTLISALEQIAAMDLRQTANQAAAVDLTSVLEELRIVVEPSFRERDIQVQWDIAPDLPLVWADRQSLMQVFLNLTKNSERALSGEIRRELWITATTADGRVIVQVRDTGCGVAEPERLFRPFQREARATGLGLYLSRAFLRSFRGDVHFEPAPTGATFVVELSAAPGGAENYESGDPDPVSGRSRTLPRESQPASPVRA